MSEHPPLAPPAATADARSSAVPQALPDFAQDLGHGVFVIDTGFQRDHFDAAYLVVQQGRGAFIDTGTLHAVPRLLATLRAVGLDVADIDWVIATHVHLDHAGGVGALMQQLPAAQLLVHPRGLRHMVDPSALWAGATAVYGPEEMARSYGSAVPVDADRVVASSDGLTVDLAGRPLLLVDTPGHARHHHCIWDAVSRGWFTGDTFGLSYREFDTERGAWIMPTTTPVQFEPDALKTSIERLLEQQPARMYLTHYGCVDDVPRLGRLLLELLAELKALGQAVRQAPDRHEALKRGQLALFSRSLADQGCRLPGPAIAELLSLDLELNAQGIGIWLDKQAA